MKGSDNMISLVTGYFGTDMYNIYFDKNICAYRENQNMYTFQYDNLSMHTITIAKAYFEREKICKMFEHKYR